MAILNCFVLQVNPELVGRLEKGGLCFTGKDITGRRLNHPYYVGVQFHPEFKSKPGKPTALFSGLIAASCGELESLVQFDQTNNNICSKRIHNNNNNGDPMIYQNGNGNGNGKPVVLELDPAI
ncbi:CTP synthase-like [Cannabis sativa]|uniref:CTP synthase-like n=1 Tax=Cannabis sativa TaxID=3483 RepID=UPI0029C9E728|nr:CTP synthase-like [Cannabis sativa]